MLDGAERIATALKEQIVSFKPTLHTFDVGTVLEVGDGIARIAGLPSVMAGELLRFENGLMGVALNLEFQAVGAIILGDPAGVQEGSMVQQMGRIVSVPVGEALVGRVVNALGQPLDNRGAIKAQCLYPVERAAPGVLVRESVRRPLQTGIKAIDAMVPIGRGQRELIIGDRQTGKTAIAVDTIINQRAEDMVCIYVAIGQKLSSIAHVVATLQAYGAMDHTIVVAAPASDPATLQYLAPYAGCAMGEYLMESGRDALIIYDDLTKHAWAYRQISLLLRRPPGREAYPGDIFYLHSRLLERAAKLDQAHGGGSLTAIPIIETQLGDLAAYVPTNVISITDGQIFLDSDLFHAGVRPAINVGLSVSRVGGSAQTKVMKQVAGRLRLDLAQYRAQAAFAQFGSDLDRATQAQIERGVRIVEILKQPQYTPMPLDRQIVALYAATHGHVDDLPVERVCAWEEGLYSYLAARYADLLAQLATGEALSEETMARLDAAIAEFSLCKGAN